MIGWFGSDLVNDVANAVGGAAQTVVNVVPGAQAIVNALSGPLKDFANTTIGRVVLSALASSVTGGLATVVGPQLATVAFAIPGVAAGQDFYSAWTQEFGNRVGQMAQIVGPGVAGPWVATGLAKIMAYLQQAGISDPAAAGLTMRQLATAAGAPDFCAATVLDKARGKLQDLIGHTFDPATGMATDIPQPHVVAANQMRSTMLLSSYRAMQAASTEMTRLSKTGGTSMLAQAQRDAAKPAPAKVSAVAAAKPAAAAASSKTPIYLAAAGGAALLAVVALKKKRR